MVAGYTLILLVDKVLFDQHAVLDHDHHGEGHGKVAEVRQSIASMVKDSIAGNNEMTED